ncbi:MAG: peptide deformylase [Candidatus Promineifilaceae bacterium]
MTILTIENLDNPILRQTARPVMRFDAAFQRLVDDMIDTMREANGAGLAGPQVNQSLQVAVIEPPPKLDEEGNEIEGSRPLYVLVNPKIVWQSEEMVEGIEGCLSIPGWLGEVARARAVRLMARDRHGKKIRLRLGGWTARIAQHEIDHLNGILYVNRLTAPENFWTEEEFEQAVEGQPGEVAIA